MIRSVKQHIKKVREEILLKPVKKFKGRFLLENKDFTIISNNCWGGIVYNDYGLEYSSPTVGVYFFAEEYIKFLRNLKKYIETDLNFIDSKESKYYNYMIENNHDTNVLIGKIGDVEIVFLHYKSKEEAYEKWNRRKERINWENLIIKFNDQNLCTEDLIREFDNLPFKNKVCFTAKPYNKCDSVIVFKEFFDKSYVLNDTKRTIYKRYFNVTKYINEMF